MKSENLDCCGLLPYQGGMARSVLKGAIWGAGTLSLLFGFLMAVSFDSSMHYVFVHAQEEIVDSLDAAEYGAFIGLVLGAIVGALVAAAIHGTSLVAARVQKREL